MKVGAFLEIFFVIAAGLAMPFIVIGSYYNLVSSDERSKPLTVLFLVISIVYALLYSYFSWKGIRESKSWERIVKGRKTEEKGEK